MFKSSACGNPFSHVPTCRGPRDKKHPFRETPGRMINNLPGSQRCLSPRDTTSSPPVSQPHTAPRGRPSSQSDNLSHVDTAHPLAFRGVSPFPVRVPRDTTPQPRSAFRDSGTSVPVPEGERVITPIRGSRDVLCDLPRRAAPHTMLRCVVCLGSRLKLPLLFGRSSPEILRPAQPWSVHSGKIPQSPLLPFALPARDCHVLRLALLAITPFPSGRPRAMARPRAPAVPVARVRSPVLCVLSHRASFPFKSFTAPPYRSIAAGSPLRSSAAVAQAAPRDSPVRSPTQPFSKAASHPPACTPRQSTGSKRRRGTHVAPVIARREEMVVLWTAVLGVFADFFWGRGYFMEGGGGEGGRTIVRGCS